MVRIYKGEFYLLRICQRQVNGILEPARIVKIREFDSSSRCKSRVGGYRVSNASTLKLTTKTRVYGVYIYYGKIRSRQS